MSRLTYTDEELAEFENMDCPVKANDLVNRFCDIVCDEFQSNCPFKELGKKLKAYEDKQEQGLLIELPCKVGSKVFLICSRYTKCTEHGVEFDDYSCEGCECLECDSRREYYIHENHSVSLEWIVRYLNDFGVRVFLTRSEAEEALAKMGGK